MNSSSISRVLSLDPTNFLPSYLVGLCYCTKVETKFQSKILASELQVHVWSLPIKNLSRKISWKAYQTRIPPLQIYKLIQHSFYLDFMIKVSRFLAVGAFFLMPDYATLSSLMWPLIVFLGSWCQPSLTPEKPTKKPVFKHKWINNIKMKIFTLI